jgi:Flp pilus assembly protein TadD
MLQAQTRYDEAEKELREALTLSPNNAEAKRYLAAVSKLKSN